MGRRIVVGVNPGGLGNFSIENNVITNVLNNSSIVLDPLGQGAVQLPTNYLIRSGIDNNSIMPKTYTDNNIALGPLFINLE